MNNNTKVKHENVLHLSYLLLFIYSYIRHTNRRVLLVETYEIQVYIITVLLQEMRGY